MNKVRVDEAGSTDLIGGSTIDYKEYREKLDAIKERIANGEKDLELPQATDVILGITKARLTHCLVLKKTLSSVSLSLQVLQLSKEMLKKKQKKTLQWQTHRQQNLLKWCNAIVKNT